MSSTGLFARGAVADRDIPEGIISTTKLEISVFRAWVSAMLFDLHDEESFVVGWDENDKSYRCL